MDKVYRLIQESMACYRKMIELYGSLRVKISSGQPSDKLNILLNQCREINKMAQYVDRKFQKLVVENQVSVEDIPLFWEWKDLLDQVQRENKFMRRYLRSNMAVLIDDIHRLGHAKKAMSGYRAGKDERRGHVNVCSA